MNKPLSSCKVVKLSFTPLVKRAQAIGYQLKEIRPSGGRNFTTYRLKHNGGKSDYTTSSLTMIEIRLKELENKNR